MRLIHCGRGSLRTAPRFGTERLDSDYPPLQQGVPFAGVRNRKEKARVLRASAHKGKGRLATALLSSIHDRCLMTCQGTLQTHPLHQLEPGVDARAGAAHRARDHRDQPVRAPSRARESGPGDGRQRDAEIQAEDGEAVVLIARNVDRVQLHGAEVVSGHRERRDEEAAVVVGRAVDSHQGTAKHPALELELVTRARDLRPVAPRIPVNTALEEPYAALVLMDCVAQAEPGVEFVEFLAANALPVGVVREAV